MKSTDETPADSDRDESIAYIGGKQYADKKIKTQVESY